MKALVNLLKQEPVIDFIRASYRHGQSNGKRRVFVVEDGDKERKLGSKEFAGVLLERAPQVRHFTAARGVSLGYLMTAVNTVLLDEGWRLQARRIQKSNGRKRRQNGRPLTKRDIRDIKALRQAGESDEFILKYLGRR